MLPMNTGNTGIWWNYSNPSKPDYSETLEGTVVELEQVQTRRPVNGVQVPQFFSDGNPMLSIRMTILNSYDNQDYLLEFPTGKNSRMIKAISAALPNSNDLEDLAGKYIRIYSPMGIYNREHPRPFTVEVLGDSGKQYYRGTKLFDASKAVQAQAQQAPTQVPPMQQAPAVGYPQASQAPMPPVQQPPMRQAPQASVPQVPAMQQPPVQQPPVQQSQQFAQNQQMMGAPARTTAQLRQQQGIPQVPAQQVPAAPMQQVPAAASPYDEDIPF